MIAHVVLFKPKPELTADERRTFVDALQHALTNIDLIARATIGRRVTLGRRYDQQNAVEFPFAAILEFATEADLRAYLEHPAHVNLGRQFYFASDAALVYDFERLDGNWSSTMLAPAGQEQQAATETQRLRGTTSNL